LFLLKKKKGERAVRSPSFSTKKGKDGRTLNRKKKKGGGKRNPEEMEVAFREASIEEGVSVYVIGEE